MSFFNDKVVASLFGGAKYCPKCGAVMDFDEEADILTCPSCGYEMEGERYGFTDEEYEELYPTREEVLGIIEEEEEDDDSGETYDEVYGELDD